MIKRDPVLRNTEANLAQWKVEPLGEGGNSTAKYDALREYLSNATMAREHKAEQRDMGWSS
jgi:hypothetical protein